MQCSQCGFYNRPGAHYCMKCGGTFQQSQTDDSPVARIPKFVWIGLTIIGLLTLSFMVGVRSMSRGPFQMRGSTSIVSGSIRVTPAEAVPTSSNPPSAEVKTLQNESAPEIANRERLREYFRSMMATAKPQLKYIGSEITEMNSGYALWATNEIFSRDSFSKGDDAKLVSAWIAQNRTDLQKANIVRVGLMGKGPSSSFCWLDLK